MREHLNFHGFIDGVVITYRGEAIWKSETQTGAARVMTLATEALDLLEQTLAKPLERKAA